MMPRHRSPHLWRLLACAALLGAVTTSACVEDVGLIDRTSPDKIDKRLFEGVWIYTQTTIDVPYSSAVSFVGEQPFLGGTKKVMFDVQEDWLIAYPVTETIQGAEADWKVQHIRKYWDPDRRDEFVDMYVGPPVARWPITSHFDVKRNYNTFNGAQSNEVTENTTDRPWYQRDYVRVNWARQGIQDFFYSLKEGNSDAYYVGQEREGAPDQLTMDREGGYFDFVVHTVAWSSGQDRCSIYTLSPYDCAKAEVQVRHSFRRLDHRRDYEPIRYHNDEHQERFGFFATERPFYDQDWGPSYKGSVAFADRWNLWMNTYDFQKPVDESGAEMTIDCFVDKDCDRDNGQRCQKDTGWFDTGYCATPIARPYQERGLRPIIYHMNADWHPDYLGAGYATADSWSDVFKDAIAWLFYYEEKGIARPRACETHAECTEGLDVLVDETLSVLDRGLLCHGDIDCGSGTCDAGFCAITRTCSASNPCAADQTCSNGKCLADGAEVLERLSTQTLHSSSVVIGKDGNYVVTHDNFPSRIRSTIGSGNAIVRFVNLDPEGGALGLNVGGTAIAGGAFDASLDLDPIDPATASYMAVVPGGSGVSIKVTSGGTTVEESAADIVANGHYLIVWNGEEIIVAGATFNASQRGMRLVHANTSAGPLDLGVEGIKMAEAVPYRGASDYYSSSGTKQRATVTRAGARGDITCYQADTIGQCVGWPAAFTDADRDRVRTIKAGLPEMFVLCQNQFDAIAATETFASDEDRAAALSDARYTRPNGYNPCGDPALVPQPEALKRIGDARYSFFNWIDEMQRSGPLGYGPSQSDPDSGQILTANANIYGGAVHTYAQYAQDIIDLVNGDLGTSDVITGRYIREYFENRTSEEDAETATYYGALSTDPEGTPSAPDVATAGERIKGLRVKLDAPVVDTDLSPGMKRALDMDITAPRRQVRDTQFPELMHLLAHPEELRLAVDAALPKVDPSTFHNRLGKIRGTWLEDLMINNEVKLAAEYVDPTGEMSAEDLHSALSPATWSTKYAMKKEAERTAIFARNNVYMADFVDDAIYGLAKQLKNDGLSGDALRLAVGQRILRGVLEHEVGHTVGLRHNFSGSTDVFNFFDEYYAIRERELILCQDDGWCDDATSETCAVKSCGADGDCPAGTLCDGGLCSAPSASGSGNLVPTGSCSAPVVGVTSCVSDAACGDSGEVCFENKCYSPREQLVPRPWMTDLEKAGRRTEYQYTSIMDYGGRFNSDLHGLGKYDYAAIRFGYTQLVDVYADTSLIEQRVEKVAQVTGGSPATYSYYRQARFWPSRGTGFFHPFNYLNNYIGVEANLNRVPVPYDQAKLQEAMATNDVREYLDVAYIQVPYAYCSDEYRGNMGCYYFDQGIDMGEMAAGATDQLEQYYIFDAFKRERLYYGSYGNPLGYYSRLMDRYLRILGDVGMYYAYFDNVLFRYSWYQEWKDMPLGGRTAEQAALDAYATLKDTIAAPSPGSYAYDSTMGAYTNISLTGGADGSEFDVPFGVGRFPYTQFGADLGYNFYEHPLWFGSFWEKLGALVTLTDSTAYFVDTAVGEQLSIGVGTSLGYNTVFASDLNNFLGGVVSEQLDFYAGRLTNGKYVPPSISGRRLQDPPVEPALNNFTLKLYSALYGLAFLPAGFDPQFIDRMAVFLEGEATQYERSALAGLDEYRFVDPIGGKVYVAYATNYGDYGEAKVDTAAELVLRAQDLADDWEIETDSAVRADLQRRMRDIVEVLDVLRMLNHTYGTSTLGF